MRAATTKGKTVKFRNTRCWIRDRLLGMESLVDKLYHLDCSDITQEHVAVASGSWIGNKADLWHQRLGHLNEHQLKEMVSQNLAKGVEMPKSTEISFCEKCVEGKMSKRPFKSVGEICSTRNYSVCIVMYVDLCLQILLEERNTFIDDYTRRCKVYFIKNKSEINKFKEFELCTTNECVLSIGTL